jgi:hypothetical protein
MLIYKILTSFVIIIHLSFIAYVILGGLLILRWKKSIFLHIPAIIWGSIVEYLNIICPLTPLENYFRRLAGYSTYSAGFIDQYITPLIYPENLERNTQLLLGSFVVIINLIIYTFVIIKLRHKSVQ